MKISKIVNVTMSSLPPFEDYINEIKPIWDNHYLTNQGPIHEKFRVKLKEYLKTDGITLFTNGHLALEAALSTLPQIDGEIITTPYTFASTTHAIVRSGYKPVFCDIRFDNYTIDASKIESLITEKTVAILPVHVYGNTCDVHSIEDIAKKYNLKVIYDAAHVFGVEIDGKPIIQFGDISMLSFHATKVFHSVEGGALAYNNALYEKELDLFKNFGISGAECVDKVGFNAKMSEFHAAMGVVNLKYVNDEIAKRKIVYEEYGQFLKNINGIKIPSVDINVKQNYAYYPVIITEEYPLTRDELFDKLKDNNVFARKYFYPIVNEFNCYKNIYDSNETPIAKYVSDRVITLPIYGDIDLEVVREVCKIIGN